MKAKIKPVRYVQASGGCIMMFGDIFMEKLWETWWQLGII